jgi:ribonuclease Z
MLFSNIKNGKDVTLDDGRVIDNVELTFDPKPMRYAFVPTQPIMRLLFH